MITACSGCAGLAYEIIWTQQLGGVLGHEYVAVLAVLAAFFAGASAGALLFARSIQRSRWPARWYAACEAVICVWALGLSLCLPRVGALLSGLVGAEPSALWHWTVAFVGPFLLLLPATAAMGVSLPAIERALNRGIAGVYAANTFGAVVGVLGATFVLIPRFGLAHTAQLCAAANATCALVALDLGHKPGALQLPAAGRGERGVFALLAAAGVLGLGYEVLVVRVVSQVNEDTVYTFAILLAVYLVGTTLGAAIYQRLDWSRELLCSLVALACLIGIGSLWFAQPLALALGQGSVARALCAESAIAVAAFLPPAAAMGMLFSRLCQDARSSGAGLGAAFAANTAGAACAPLLFGVMLLPRFGAKPLLLAIVLGYVLLSGQLRWRSAAIGCVTLLLGLTGPSLAVVDVPEGGRLVHYADGVTASVSVVEDAQGVTSLRIDNRQQEGSSATLIADARQAWLPLLLHPQPHSALFLGLGTGVTAGAAAWHPRLQVDAVELIPEVAAAAASFRPVLDSPRAPRVVLGDARRFVRAAARRYDVIVADLFHPARSGSGALYTVEHFAAVRARLSPWGLFCQWLPLHQLDLETLRSIVAAFSKVYPEALALLATNSLDTPVLGLLAQPGVHGFAVEPLRARLGELAGPARLDQLQLDEGSVLGSFIAGPRSLQRWAAGAALNTDDRPLVSYRASRLLYAPDSTPRERLLLLLRALEVQPAELLPDADLPAHAAPLAAYLAARERYLSLGTRVRFSSDPRAMLQQLQSPLLEILAASPNFRPAYDPLLNMAAALPPGEARSLLAALNAVQPARREAARLLQRIEPASGGLHVDP